MTKWRLEKRTVPDRIPPFPDVLLVADNGVSVRMAFTRHWFAKYVCADLSFEFSVHGDNSSGGDNEIVIGPSCVVGALSYISRSIEKSEWRELATNIKEALREHLLVPGAVPPRVERIRFIHPQLKPFSD